MRLITRLSLIAAMVSPSVALATPDKAAPMPSEVRLSDEEKEKVLEEAAARRRGSVTGVADEKPEEGDPARQVHGEVGFSVGTGGYRSAYGTAVVPLEGEGVAILSLGTTDFGSRSLHSDPWWW